MVLVVRPAVGIPILTEGIRRMVGASALTVAHILTAGTTSTGAARSPQPHPPETCPHRRSHRLLRCQPQYQLRGRRSFVATDTIMGVCRPLVVALLVVPVGLVIRRAIRPVSLPQMVARPQTVTTLVDLKLVPVPIIPQNRTQPQALIRPPCRIAPQAMLAEG